MEIEKDQHDKITRWEDYKLSSIFQSFAELESDYVIPVASASGMGIQEEENHIIFL